MPAGREGLRGAEFQSPAVGRSSKVQLWAGVPASGRAVDAGGAPGAGSGVRTASRTQQVLVLVCSFPSSALA